MIKFLYSLAGVLPASSAANGADEARCWRRDPLAHPVLEAMDARQLGDLPFGRARILPEHGANDGCATPCG